MTDIIWTSNGQGAFDFDYLLNLTNQDFVEGVQRDIEQSISFSAIKVEEFGKYVKSYVVSPSSVRLRYFDKETSEMFFDMLTYFDIEWIWGAMNGKR